MYLGLGDDPTTLEQVIAFARNAQDAHHRMLGTIQGWEEREPGKMSADGDLRNEFINQLNGLRSHFTSQVLPLVGVTFPLFLNELDPAQAIIIAVRNDIGNTVSALEANTAQQLLGKQIKEIPNAQYIAQSALDATKEGAAGVNRLVNKLTPDLNKAASDAGDALKDLAKALPWIAGAMIAVAGVIYFKK